MRGVGNTIASYQLLEVNMVDTILYKSGVFYHVGLSTPQHTYVIFITMSKTDALGYQNYLKSVYKGGK